jgi:hypothetical protein
LAERRAPRTPHWLRGAAADPGCAIQPQMTDTTKTAELIVNTDAPGKLRASRPARARGAMAMLCLALATLPAMATESSVDLQYRATLYAYAPDVSANTVFPGGTVPINVSASDIIRRTDLALMGVFEARKNRFGGFADVIALNLSDSKSGLQSLSLGGEIALPPGVSVGTALTIRMRAMTFAGEWQALDTPTADIELFAGARLLDMTTRLHYAFSADFGPFSGPARQGTPEVTVENWDRVAGAKGRYSWGPQHKSFLFAYADAGTGDSRLTWQGLVTVGRRFGRFDMAAGWRHVAYEFKSGGPIDRLNFDGPLVGASITW